MNKIEERLNNLHFRLGLNRSGMAKRLGVSRDKYLRIRMGSTEPPAEFLEKIAFIEEEVTDQDTKPSYALKDHEPLKLISAEAIDHGSVLLPSKDAAALIILLLSENKRLRKKLAKGQ